MKTGFLILTVVLALVCRAPAGTCMLAFVYQPLTTLGTDGDAGVVVARIPVLTNAVPESVVMKIAAPNRLLQEEQTGVADSNLVSLLKMHLAVELVARRHFRLTLDLRDMRPCEPYGVTPEEVVAGTIQCLKATFDEDVNLGSYELRIVSRQDDKTDWRRHEGRYESVKQKKR